MRDWTKYIQKTKGKSHTPLVEEAINYVTSKDRALDLGAGVMADAAYLIEQGFKMVDVVDVEPSVMEIAENMKEYSMKIQIHILPFDQFVFNEKAYDFVNAQNAIPFAGHEYIEGVMEGIKYSLKQGSIFCGTLFGPDDEWAKDPDVAVMSRTQVEGFFNSKEWNVHKLEEERAMGKTADGNDKHWHIFHIIAEKK